MRSAKPTGQLTCFGGSRERGETPEQCVVRELYEELRWDVHRGQLTMAVRLVNSGSKVMRFRAGPVRPRETIAWFFRGEAPGPDVPLVTEPKHQAVWLTPEELVSADLSLWHRVAIEAELKGFGIANVER